MSRQSDEKQVREFLEYIANPVEATRRRLREGEQVNGHYLARVAELLYPWGDKAKDALDAFNRLSALEDPITPTNGPQVAEGDTSQTLKRSTDMEDTTNIQNEEHTGRLQQPVVVRSAIGHSVDDDDMQWTVNCPECSREYRYEGYFESTDIDTCKCGCVYRTERVYFEDGSFME